GDGVNHQTSPAQPSPGDGQRPKGPAPPPPPRWRNWLIFMGILLTLLLLFRPAMRGGSATLTYSQFLDDVQADKVQTATIDANGAVEGKLKDGTLYTSQIPVALQDTTVSPLLQQ